MSGTTSVARRTTSAARRGKEGASFRRTAEGGRRTEILATAATLFATSGLLTSLKDVADACGILPGSLYHHFASKDALLIELVERYQDELDRVGRDAVDALREPAHVPVNQHIADFGRAIASCAVRHRGALMLTFYEPPMSASNDFVSLARRTPTVYDVPEYNFEDTMVHFPPEQVSPAAAYLAHQSCRLNGEMLVAGGGQVRSWTS
jgi:AcrR family transcriptional regulator